MEATILTDGRRVQTEGCLSLENALQGRADTEGLTEIFEERGAWYITCQCCSGSMEHFWSPSGYGVDPNGGHYQCGPCAGRGSFKIQMP